MNDLLKFKMLPLLSILGYVCNLYVVHGVFCTGMKVTGWKLDDIFKAMYSFFKNTYKRRTDFVEVTGTGMFNYIVN